MEASKQGGIDFLYEKLADLKLSLCGLKQKLEQLTEKRGAFGILL